MEQQRQRLRSTAVCRPTGRPFRVAASVALLLFSGGCDGISIQPSCPAELRVGDSGAVMAQEENPGAIATYLWEIIPATAGRFTDPLAPDTTFQALEEGEATIRLTASDGLYQVVSQCTTIITGVAELAVALSADPDLAYLGENVTLECSDVGLLEIVDFTIEQTDGPTVVPTEVREGVVRFTADELGLLTFACVGSDAEGVASPPSSVVVEVIEPPPANENDNIDNANDNANENLNDNGSENVNENENDNEASNENDNTGANLNDNFQARALRGITGWRTTAQV